MDRKTADAVLADLYKANDNPQVMYHIESQVDFLINAVVIRKDEPLNSPEFKFQVTRTYHPVKGIFITPVSVKDVSGNWIGIPDVKTNCMSDDILAFMSKALKPRERSKQNHEM